MKSVGRQRSDRSLVSKSSRKSSRATRSRGAPSVAGRDDDSEDDFMARDAALLALLLEDESKPRKKNQKRSPQNPQPDETFRLDDDDEARQTLAEKYGSEHLLPSVEMQRYHHIPGVIHPPSEVLGHKTAARKIFVVPGKEDVLPEQFASQFQKSFAPSKTNDDNEYSVSAAPPGKFRNSLGSMEFVPSFAAPAPGDHLPKIRAEEEEKLIDFADVVDEDDAQAFESYVSGTLALKLVESNAFRLTVLIAILMNTVLVGLQTSATMELNYGAGMQAVDKVLLTIFFFEILLKWYNNFWTFWKVGWNVFDFMLVFISIVGDGLDFLRTGRVLRIFRVLRAFRSLRSISAVKGLQLVVQTIIRSIPDMGNIIALLLIVMFIFSVVGVDLFGSTAPEYFGGIDTAMYTLFITMTQDGWAQIYNDMRDRGQGLAAAIFFGVYVIVGAFIFANIIVGVTVTNIQLAYRQQKSAKRVKDRQLTSSGKPDGLEADAGSNEHILKAVPIDTVPDSLWSSQLPREIPDFRNFTVRALENYLLTLTALEDNLVEYQGLVGELQRIYSRVILYNEHEEDAGGSDDDQELLNDVKGENGVDVLTKTLAREKHQEKKTLKNNTSAAAKKRTEMKQKLEQRPDPEAMKLLDAMLLRHAKAEEEKKGDGDALGDAGNQDQIRSRLLEIRNRRMNSGSAAGDSSQYLMPNSVSNMKALLDTSRRATMSQPDMHATLASSGAPNGVGGLLRRRVGDSSRSMGGKGSSRFKLGAKRSSIVRARDMARQESQQRVASDSDSSDSDSDEEKK